MEPSEAKLAMNRKSQRHYSKDCMGKAGNANNGNVRVPGSIPKCQLAKGPMPTKHRIRTEHGTMTSATDQQGGNETGVTSREYGKPRDHSGITLKALTEACKGLHVWYSRVMIAVWERSIRRI